MKATDSAAERLPTAALGAVFFASGFAAILYQLVWQRSLFRIYGTNMESITLVVTAFMLGLGLGSLGGGALSTRAGWPLPAVFGVLEILIGGFGLVSLPLFAWVASFTSAATGLEIGLIAFAVVLVPTTLMGATLPLLVAHVVRRSRNVGDSVGLLYFINTLGSAAGCFAASLWVFGRFGQSWTVLLAAATNFAVGGTVLGAYLLRRGTRA
jgi:predicted membrane-bound spermidine synthase